MYLTLHCYPRLLHIPMTHLNTFDIKDNSLGSMITIGLHFIAPMASVSEVLNCSFKVNKMYNNDHVIHDQLVAG